MKKRTLKDLAILLLVYICALSFFKIPIASLLNKLFVEPLFKSFETGFPNELLLITLSIVCGLWILRTTGKEHIAKWATISLIFYIFQRNTDYWHFYSFSFSENIKLWDIPILMLVISGIIKRGRKQAHIPEAPLNEGFTEDNPVIADIDDTFERKTVAKEIARLIMLTHNKKSFAIGILGEYGSGKTSFLNLIANTLNKDKTEIMYFNPWSSENAQSIQKDLFDQLASKLSDINPILSSLIYSYSRKLSRIDNSTQSIISRLNFLNNFYTKDHYNDDYQRLNQMIATVGKKIVIVIDDLDRLYDEEVIEVLRLIRNTANFSNIFYLVAYEKSYVTNALKSLNDKSNLTYLDKIFQFEIPLPKREVDNLIKTLQEELKGHISEVDYQHFEERIIPYGFKNQFEKSYNRIFRHSRDIVKFINGFRISYNLISEEVDFENLFVLELIKFRYPLIYDLIYEQKDTFLYLRPSIASHEEFYIMRLLTEAKDSKNEVSQFRKHLEDVDFINKDDLDLLDSLFKNLFSGSAYNKPKTKNSISYPLFYEIYFKYRLSSYDLSEKDFVYALNSGNDTLYKFIDNCISNELHHSILTRLLQENPLDKRNFEILIHALFYLGPKYVQKTSSRSFPYKDLINLLTDFRGEIVNQYYQTLRDDYFKFIASFFDTASPPYIFHNELIYEIKHLKNEFIIPTDKLIAYQVIYFEKYINTYGLNNNGMWLFWGIREEYSLPAEQKDMVYNKWRFEATVIPKMKEYLQKKDPKYFLKGSIYSDMRSVNMATIHSEILEIFERPEELRTIVSKNPELDSKIKEEYLEFFDLCATHSFKQYIPYEFQTELKPVKNK